MSAPISARMIFLGQLTPVAGHLTQLTDLHRRLEATPSTRARTFRTCTPPNVVSDGCRRVSARTPLPSFVNIETDARTLAAITERKTWLLAFGGCSRRSTRLRAPPSGDLRGARVTNPRLFSAARLLLLRRRCLRDERDGTEVPPRHCRLGQRRGLSVCSAGWMIARTGRRTPRRSGSGAERVTTRPSSTHGSLLRRCQTMSTSNAPRNC